MSKVKKQHFVPRFYLQQFAHTNGRVHVFDKFAQASYSSNTKDIATRKYFYDLSEEEINDLREIIIKRREAEDLDWELADKLLNFVDDSQMIEKHLSAHETRFAKILNNTLESLDHRNRFKDKYRSELSLFMAFQFWRTYGQREIMHELDKGLENNVMRIVNSFNEINGTDYKAEDLEIDYDPKETILRHKMMMLDMDVIQETAGIFENHIWSIGVNTTSKPLYTSDNPIARRPHKNDDWRSNSGIASPGIEVVFPISHKYIIMMYERSYFSAIKHQDGRLATLKPDNVTYYNSLQVSNSYHQIYSRDDNFDLAIEMCQKLPELTNRNRSRFDFG